ncbi:polymerase [Salanga virus]|uniref:RNA-directed RNA polymerase L n=1 Tax=Salanga virus TaxID=1416745 RepID=U5XLH5_9VIRU|nr:polymerase [Salanga virus]AGZ62535.1 polymerase [Salanga virus]
MDEIIRKQPRPRNGFNCGNLTHYSQGVNSLGLPAFFVNRDPSGITIEVLMSPIRQISSIGSSIKDNLKVSAAKMPNFIHDFTFGHLASHTDTSFSSVFPTMNDTYDDYTPDLIIKTTSGNYCVAEFTTFRGLMDGARVAAETKISKYELACRNRASNSSVSLYVISVHKFGVWSNLTLGAAEVNELVFRFRLAVDIEKEITVLFPDLAAVDEDKSKLEREVSGILCNVDIKWERTEDIFPSFKKKMFSRFRDLTPDQDYVTSIISKCINKAQEDLVKGSFFLPGKSLTERLQMNRDECERAISGYLDSLKERDFLRDTRDHKSTVQLPPWVSWVGEEGKDLDCLKPLRVEGDHPMCEVWRTVCLKAAKEEIDRMQDDPVEELRMAMEGQKDRPDERNKYHRVRVEMDPWCKEYLATLGVGGKQLKDSALVKDARLRSKMPFSPDHDTSFLDSFLYGDSSKDFETDEDLFTPMMEDYDLRILAQSIHQPSFTVDVGENEFLRNHRLFLQTPFGSWLQMVSLIGAELSASVKQHVKPGSFVVKRLLGSNILLLIKPTSSKSHIFVSLALLKSGHMKDLENSECFKPYIDAGDLYITEFVSYKQSKLTNLCKAVSLMESTLCFWTECYGGLPWKSVETALSKDTSDTSHMFKLSLLTLMEDKATTEELQTLQRYVTMEGFVSQPDIPKPHKMVSKLPKLLRSELQVHLLHRMLNSMRRISEKPFLLTRDNSSIFWSQLFNPLTGSEVRDIPPVINSCYNGYFKNKEEETEPSALSSMYKKIIELEHLRPSSDDNLGWEDPKEPAMHEFSVSYLKETIQHSKKLLQRVYGQSFMEQIDSDIMREVSSLTLEKLATLKATSNFNESWYVYKDVKDKNYTRDKLLVKMAEFASSGKTLAVEMFDECMTRIETKGCMDICLFKKQQHGGLREIYVMGADERIVQSLVEAIARTIGRYFASDTLCNPSNKMKIPESHGSRARAQCKGRVWTCATSDDARKWNQGHFVTKFALMLCEFTERKWWPIIIRGCSMFTRKRMMMNLRYLEILDGHRELAVDDDFVMDLYEAYHGNVQKPWMKKGCTYLETTTGMMQGILHYTSSLLHTLHQEYIRSLTFRIFNSKVAPDISRSMVCDMMQGSDDSSMIISFPHENEQTLMRCKVAASICFRVKKLLGVYLAIYPSEKSTSNTDFVMEYNSEFFFHSQHVRPTIRWVASSCSLPEVETLVARQEEAANLLTSISEGGGSFALSAMIQQSQCMLHYMLMGMGVSQLFKHFATSIKRWVDPGLGFFLLDNPFIAGLPGFRYNLYKAITQTNLQMVYAFFLRRVRTARMPESPVTVEEQVEKSWGDMMEEYNRGDRPRMLSVIPETCSVSPGGALILSSSLKWGSKQKFIKLRNRLNIPDDWTERINENPHVLYRAPRTGEEILLRIAEKVHSPGVVSSLSTGNAVCKVMASAVYFLSAAIFENSGRPEFNYLETSKYSLIERLAKYDLLDMATKLDPAEIMFLFPNAEEFYNIDMLVFDRQEIDISMRTNKREATQVRVVIFDQISSARCAAEKLVSDKWFGTQKCRIGSKAFDEEWKRLQDTVQWLEDDPAKTLESSPLHNHIQIKNFFARMEGKQRVVRVTGAPVKSRSGVGKLAMVVRDNFCKVAVLNHIESNIGLTRSTAADNLKHVLFSILRGPYLTEYKKSMCESALLNMDNVVTNAADGKTKSNVISLLQMYSRGEKGLIEAMMSVGAGTLGGYIKPQKFKEVDGKRYYYDRGIWVGTMDGAQVHVTVDNKLKMPPQIISVMIYGTREPWIITQSLRAWADDMGVENTKNSYNEARHSRKASFWMYGFKMTGHNSNYGCPVILLDTPLREIVDINQSEIDLKVRGSTINLYVRGKDRDLHILSYTASDHDMGDSAVISRVKTLIAAQVLGADKEPSRSWMTCSELDKMLWEPVLNIMDGSRHTDKLDPVKLKDIVSTCTQSALRLRVGTIYSMLPPVADLAVTTDMSTDMDMIFEYDMDEIFETVVEQMIEDEGEYGLADFTGDGIISDIDLDLFGPAHYKEISNLSMISHPLMNGLVDAALAQMGRRRELRRLLETRKTHRIHMTMARILFRALGKDPDSIRQEEIGLDFDFDVEDDMIG